MAFAGDRKERIDRQSHRASCGYTARCRSAINPAFAPATFDSDDADSCPTIPLFVDEDGIDIARAPSGAKDGDAGAWLRATGRSADSNRDC
jgi:hypothetical protein